MDILGKLFGSENKVKMMRLFLFNSETTFSTDMVADRINAGVGSTGKELITLRQMKFIKPKSHFQNVLVGKKGKKKTERQKVPGFVLNASFPYLKELQRLLLDTSLLKGDEITRQLASAGKLKLVIIAGLFIQDQDSRLDILVVGDHLKRGTVDRKIKAMESEIGKELRYAAFETSEFNYRLGLYDKLIRDVLDYPHLVAFDRLGIPPAHIGRR